MNNNRVIFSSIRYMLTIARKENKIIFLFYLLQLIGDVLILVKNMFLPKLLLDELVFIINGTEMNKVIKKLILLVLLIVVLEMVANAFKEIAQLNINLQAERFNEIISEKIAEKCMTVEFCQTENPEFLDRQIKAKEGMSWYSGGVVGILNLFYGLLMNLITVFISVGIVVLYCPIILFVQICIVSITYCFNKKNNEVNFKLYSSLAKINRVFSYIMFDLHNYKYGMDIRLYDSKDMVEEREIAQTSKMVEEFKNADEKNLLNNIPILLANGLRDAVTYLYIGYLAMNRKITIGDFSMCISATTSFSQGIVGITSSFQSMALSCNYVYEYIKFMEYESLKNDGRINISNEDKHIIEFKNVFFKYPRMDEYVLENINLKIESGQHIAIVGLNGSGKTTLIKLLCRLYKVTEGGIFIDGININDYSELEYVKLLSVVFQDFQLFAFSLKENIVLSHAGKNKKLSDCLKMAGLEKDVEQLTNGVETHISKYFEEDGIELSGGQRQKVAIARTIYKDAPIVILDEPTAALDPIAEADIYEKFNKLVNNKTAIYISHRLSSCKFCDNIVVISDKTIVEFGPHKELINKKDGIYAKLFEMQAQYYKEVKEY